MCTRHRLQALTTSLAKLALNPSALEGSFVLQVSSMLNNDFREMLELAAGGPVERGHIRTPRMPDDQDSLACLMQSSCKSSRRLLRFLTCN